MSEVFISKKNDDFDKCIERDVKPKKSPHLFLFIDHLLSFDNEF